MVWGCLYVCIQLFMHVCRCASTHSEGARIPLDPSLVRMHRGSCNLTMAAWAAKNNLRLNQLKTRELVITKIRHKSNIKPEGPVVPGAEQVSTLRVLGVVLQSNLSMGAHIDHILARCASSTH